MKTQFDTKLKELNINHYSIPDGQLERLQAFIDEFSGDKDFGKNQSIKSYIEKEVIKGYRKFAEEAINSIQADNQI